MASRVSVQRLLLLTLTAILLQTITVSVSLVYFNTVLNSMQESFSRSSVSCLMDNNLRSAPDTLSEEDRKSDPCWQVAQQLRSRIEKTMTDRLQKEMSTVMRNRLTGVVPVLTPGVESESLPKVAAHVTGTVTSGESTVSEGARTSRGFQGERVGAWGSQTSLSFLQNVELRGGELQVPWAGLYYIYAQTYFRLPPTGDAEGAEEGRQLIQYIYKKVSSYPVPILLMKSSRSVCWPRGLEPGLFSLHQAGTARLQPADRLFVTVSNASAVETDSRASYFGAFLVG